MRDPDCIFSDGCIEDPELFRVIFPATELLLCAFHIVNLDLLCKLKQVHGYDAMRTLLLKMRDAPYEQQYLDAWAKMQQDHPVAARYHLRMQDSFS